MIKLVSLQQLFVDKQICRAVHRLPFVHRVNSTNNLAAATSPLCQAARCLKLLNPLNKSGSQHYGQENKLVAGKDVQLKHT